VEENPFLASFYQDRQKYAFQTQLFFLLSRFKQQQDLFQQDLFNSVTISDYLFAKDGIFASITLDSNELALYERVYEHLGPRVLKPTWSSTCSRLDVLLARIKKRGREFERRFDAEYLAELSRTTTTSSTAGRDAAPGHQHQRHRLRRKRPDLDDRSAPLRAASRGRSTTSPRYPV